MLGPVEEEQDDVQISVGEAARVLDVDPSTVWRYIKHRGLPAKKVGRYHVLWRKDVLGFIEKKPKPGPKPRAT
jgi:excisionase family DNA binding protein